MIEEDGTIIESPPPWQAEPQEKDLKDYKCTGKEIFNTILDIYKDTMYYQRPIEYVIDALWDMHTYHMPKWDSTQYLLYEGSGNDKGKSRGLEVHARTAYRGSPISWGSDAGFRKCIQDGATLLIDQAENLWYKRSDKTFMYNACTSGYRRTWQGVNLSATDKKSYDCKSFYGAKAFNQQEDGRWDNPIIQRCFVHHMIQGTPKIKDIYRTPELNNRFNTVFKQLHWFRMAHEKTEIDRETDLTLRNAELFDPLLLTIRLYDLPSWIEKMVYIEAFEQQDAKRDIAAQTFPALVYTAANKVAKDTTSFNATSIKSWLIQNIPNKYAPPNKAPYEGTIGKILNGMGLRPRGTGINNYYDMTEQANKDILQKVGEQYNISSSIESQCLNYEAENDITPDASKSVYERTYIYRKYHTELKKLKINPISDIPQVEPIIDEPPIEEFEYPCPQCHKLIGGTDPNVMCDDCENEIKQWELEHTIPDPLDQPSDE